MQALQGARNERGGAVIVRVVVTVQEPLQVAQAGCKAGGVEGTRGQGVWRTTTCEFAQLGGSAGSALAGWPANKLLLPAQSLAWFPLVDSLA